MASARKPEQYEGNTRSRKRAGSRGSAEGTENNPGRRSVNKTSRGRTAAQSGGSSGKAASGRSGGKSRQGAPQRQKAAGGRTGGSGRQVHAGDAAIGQEIWREVAALAWGLCMLLCFLGNFGMLGTFGAWMSGLGFGLFGWNAYISPLVFFGLGLWALAWGRPILYSVQYWAGVFLFLAWLGFWEIWQPGQDLNAIYSRAAEERNGGGWVGALAAYPLRSYLGLAGGVLVLLALMAICILLLSRKSLLGILRSGGRRMERQARQGWQAMRQSQARSRQRWEDEAEEEEEEISEEPDWEEGKTLDFRSFAERQKRWHPRREGDGQTEAEMGKRMDMRTFQPLERKETEESLAEGAELSPLGVPPQGAARLELTPAGNSPQGAAPSELPPAESSRLEIFQGENPRQGIDGDFARTEAFSQSAEAGEGGRPSWEIPIYRNGGQAPFSLSLSGEGDATARLDFAVRGENRPQSDVPGQANAPGRPDTAGHGPASVQGENRPQSDVPGQANVLGRPDAAGHGPASVQGENRPQSDVPGQANVPGRPDTAGHGPASVRGENRPQSDVPGQSEQPWSDMEKEGRADRQTPVYQFPPLSYLQKGKAGPREQDAQLRQTAQRLRDTLETFGVRVQITDISQGPSVTRYALAPETGVKVSRIVNLADDIKLNLAATDIRIEAPIPGQAAIGIEVPNKETSAVALRDLLETPEYTGHASPLAMAVGRDIGGQAVVADIAKMPHMLVAGATGSGKSVFINTLIMSILYKATPEQVRLIMIDPKVVELSVYNGIPHLLIPVVTDPKKAAAALQWGVAEMSDRYGKFAQWNVRDLHSYNSLMESMAGGEEAEPPLPQIVIVVDELADLMMVCPGEVEESICRLAQLARAAGIHLILATQRPSVDVITGLIKANMPSRVAFAVSSGVDSRTILDMNGAEKLLGKGDMLFFPQGYTRPARVQGAFVSDREVSSVVDFLKNQSAGNGHLYQRQIEESMERIGQGAAGGELDPYFVQAARMIAEKDKVSITMLQRLLRIGFNRAARLMDQLCDYGIVSSEEGTKPRRVLLQGDALENVLEDL